MPTRSAPLTSILALGLSVCVLSSCSDPATVPGNTDINVNGNYAGLLLGQSDSARLDVAITEKDLAVTGSAKSLETNQTFTFSGTRSAARSSPVTVSATANLGSGSACSGGFTDHYDVQVKFDSANIGTGTVKHDTCVAGQLQPTDFNSGKLTLTRK